jgi:tetratricopeptide (TPR) repeat protein
MRELPSEPKRIIDDFPDWLAYGSEKAPLLIVIDSLTSMAEGDGALSWLPVSVPQSCRLVVSAVSDTPVERICKERGESDRAPNRKSGLRSDARGAPGWRELVVNELSDEECAQLIHQYLGSYGKQLDAEQEGLVIASRHTRNPLYLVTFLQEVRVFGVYEKVSERIRHYMEAQTVTDLFTKVLEKLEQDFEEAAPGIVARVLGYLQASRHGMSELEIRGALELNLGLGEGNATPFPVLDFTSLMLRLDADLIDQRGLRDFSHEYLRRAVQDRYLRDAAALTVHRELARFWWSRPLSSRKAEELPYHLHILCTAAPVARSPRFRQSGDSEMLKDLVHSLRARSTSPSPSPMRAPSAGRAPSLSSSVAVAAAAVTVAATDDDTADRKGGGKTPSPSSPPSSPPGRARPQSALKMTPCAGKPLLGDSSTGASDEESLSDPGRALLRTLTDISLFRLLMTPQGKLDLHRYWLVLEKRGLVPNVASAYMAPVQEFAKAAPHAGEFAAVCEQLATFLIDTDRYLGANLFLQQALSILVKQHGENHPTVENIVAKEADLAFRQGRYAEALPLYRKALAIASALQGADSLRASVLETNIAGILKEQGDFETALAMYRRSMQKKVALAGPRDPVVAVSMTNLGDLFMRMGQADKALPLYENALQILEAARGSHHPQVAVVLSSLAAAHLKLERTAEALTLFERARTIKEEALGPDHVGMAVVLNNLAGAYHSQGDAERALRLYERAVKILERYHGVESPVLVPTLTNMGMVYETQRDYEMALSLYGRALRLAEAANGPEHLDLALILSAMAAVFMHQEEFQQAAQVYSRQVAILKKHLGAADPRVAACLDSLGAAFQSTQDFDHAAEAHAEQKMSLKMALEAACARGDSESTQEELRQSLAGACVTLGAVLLTLGRHAAARENFSEALAIREQLLGKEHEKTLEARGWLEDCGEEDEVESEAESALGDRAVGLDAGQAGSAAENCE